MSKAKNIYMRMCTAISFCLKYTECKCTGLKFIQRTALGSEFASDTDTFTT